MKIRVAATLVFLAILVSSAPVFSVQKTSKNLQEEIEALGYAVSACTEKECIMYDTPMGVIEILLERGFRITSVEIFVFQGGHPAQELIEKIRGHANVEPTCTGWCNVSGFFTKYKLTVTK